MKKRFFVLQRLMLVLVFLIITSCRASQRRVMPVTGTAVQLESEPETAPLQPGILHFTPGDDHPIRLEFDYPETWDLGDSGDYSSSWRMISLHESSEPTPSPSDRHPNGENPSVMITLYFDQSKDTVDSVITDNLLRHGGGLKFIDIYKVTINSNEFIELDYERPPDLLVYPVLMFEKQMYLFVHDYYYFIRFSIPFSDRYGEFEDGFDKMLWSLKVVE
jgi:hypothetical protein